jgi:nickel/cobalt transporter (NicO) family protein
MHGLYHGDLAFANWNSVDLIWGVGVYACMTSFQEYLQHGNAWLFIPAAIALGALHGLEPGHSKTLMAAFIVAIRGTIKQAVLLGVSATISHTAIIWILALIGLHYAGQFNVETTEPYFQVATGVIVIGMAAWMFARTRREQRNATDHHHTHDHGPRGAHGGVLVQADVNQQMEISVFETDVPPRFRLYFYDQASQILAPPVANLIQLETSRPDGSTQLFEFVSKQDYLESSSDIPEPHEFNVSVMLAGSVACHSKFEEDHHHHSHDDMSPEYQDAHEREHAEELQKRFANRQVTTGQLILFGLTGGLLPCPSAFAVLLICLQLKQFTLGFALVLAFSLGLAITLVTVGSLAAFSVHHASKRFKGLGELARKAPYVSSTVMVLIGLFVGLQGLKHLLDR